MQARRLGALVAATLASGLLLAGCGDDQPGGDVGVGGTVTGSASAEVSGSEIEVLLPSGAFAFTVTEPTDTVEAAQADDGEEHEAPDGQDFVGVAWHPAGTNPLPTSAMLRDTEPLGSQVALLAGGDRVTVAEDALVGGPDGTHGLVWASVPEEADLALAVEYDGVDQVFEAATGEPRPGRADGLRAVAHPESQRCVPASDDGARAPEVALSVECRADAMVTVPYVADLGWADPDHTWLVLELTTRLESATVGGPGGAVYEAVDRATRVRLGDQEARSLGSDEDSVGRERTALAVQAPIDGPADLTVEIDHELVRSSGSAPQAPRTTTATHRADVPVTW